jgi:ATP-dependent helicase/DNAse subunit B
MADVGPVALDEVIEALSGRLRFLRQEPPPRRYGRVYVASIEEARARDFDVVFLPGLAEGLFPRKMMEDPLLLDAHRPAGLTVQEDRVRRERLLLRRAVAVASKRLIFSYPRVDVAQSRPRVPSLYALEILRAAKGKLPELRDFEKRAAEGAQSRLDWPAPSRHEDAIDDAEYDLVSLESALKNKTRGSVRYLVEVNRALGRSLRARAWRWKSRWAYPDGLVDPDDATKTALARHALTERSYSASSLQQFAQCPYRFLLHAIHQLRPRETPVALEQIDPLTRGGLFHAVQRDLFVELQSAGLLPVWRERLNQIRDVADRTLDRLAMQYEDDLAPAIPRVWRSEVEEIRTDLHAWLGIVASSDDGWLPIHFELSFGLHPGSRRDPASSPEEAVLLSGVRLRGAIDLVERHETRGTLRIVDHKTGKAPDREPVYVGGGTSLQPLLYALAAEAALGERVESSQLFYCTQRGNFQRIEASTTPSARLFIARALEIIDLSLREGFLPAAPREDACAVCDYRPVCGPHELQRSKKKKPERLEPLIELRNMP